MGTESSLRAGSRRLWRSQLRSPVGLRLLRVGRSTWLFGLLVAVASWNLAFIPPLLGLDPSWWAALYMAAHRGLRFGSELVWTYGPLGFLREPWLFFPHLAVLAFIYSALLHIALSISLVWALRRSVNALVAAVVTFLVLVATPDIEVAIVLAAVWCLAALSPRPPRYAAAAVLLGGAVLGAVETLVELRSGPVILMMCALTLIAQPRWRRLLPIFLACSVAALAAVWFATGQSAGNIGSFITSAAQIVSGYSDAMGVSAASSLYLPAAVVIGVLLVAVAALTSAPGRTRLAAVALVVVAAFSVYKEAVVRADAGHAAIFFSTAAGLAASIAYGRRRLLGLAAIAALTVSSAISLPSQTALDFNPVSHARQTSDQLQLLFDSRQRERLALYWAVVMQQRYQVPQPMLHLLRGTTVHVDPWEAAAAWTYALRWDPLPVFQDYSAYTSSLDRLNADALRSAHGPRRILRENVGLVDSQYRTPTIDSRLPAWDPPQVSIAMLCNYVPLETSIRWQVLGKVPNRCGRATRVGSIRARYGQILALPKAKAGGVLYARVHGVAVSGLEGVRAFLYRAEFRYARANGTVRYRLVPGTAADGLLLDVAPGRDYPAPFALNPSVRTIVFSGPSGMLSVALYWMPVRAG